MSVTARRASGASRSDDIPKVHKLLAAVRTLDALPRSESGDAIASLLDLAGQRYDRATFWNVLGKDRVMQSWLWRLGRDEGETRGEVRAARRSPLAVARRADDSAESAG